jgi:hypothetical protein
MSLHRGQQVLYLCHGNCASERSEVLLNPPKNPLDLPYWEVPCYCCSPGGGSCGLWPWAAPVPCKIGRSHGSHICTQHNVHPSKTLLSKKTIYIYQTKKLHIQTKKLYRRRLTHLPSLLTRRHWYRWISGKVNPYVWVVLDCGNLP